MSTEDPLVGHLAGIGKLADSKIVSKIYDDVLSGALCELGDVFTDILKAARFVTLPIKMLGAYQERLARLCDRAVKNVPLERLQPPAPSVAGPILIELAFMEDEHPLAELYVALLSRGMDRERKEEVHPAFIKIIGNLCPREVLLLNFLKTSAIQTVGVYRETEAESLLEIETLLESNFPVADWEKRERIEVYLEHLKSMHLVDSPIFGTPVAAEGSTEETPMMTMRRHFILSEFGKSFLRACES